MQFQQRNSANYRSNVMALQGMVASSQPLAAEVGLDVLKAGGNAVDAAIATAAALCVLEPYSTGIGGDAFALIWWAESGRLFGLNASGPAPSSLSSDFLLEKGFTDMPERGPLSVTVPGSLRGWQIALNRFGTFGLDTLLNRAIDYSRCGFAVSEKISQHWQSASNFLASNPNSCRVWLPGGKAPEAATIFCNGDLSATLQLLAEEGYDAFYLGRLGEQIVACIQAEGGVLVEKDLANYQAEWVQPISAAYRDGFNFHEIPPNGQGLTALLALNLVRGFDITTLGRNSADYWHILIEATKLAFADARQYIADPRYESVPVTQLLSDEYARRRRLEISPYKANKPIAGKASKGSDTVYLAVVDGEGNMVSWIQSLYDSFGSGLTAGKTGILLHNRGANFVLQAGHPNEVAPGKRPYHTIIPGFITRDGLPWATFGVMGGFMQPQGHLQVGSNLIDFKMTPQSALDVPRFRWIDGNQIALEATVPDQVRIKLSHCGHEVMDRQRTQAVLFGGGQVIVRDPSSGVLIGGSDSRKDGAAVGW